MSAENRLSPDEMECLLRGISAEIAASGNCESTPVEAGSRDVTAAERDDSCQVNGPRDAFASTANPSGIKSNCTATENLVNESATGRLAIEPDQRTSSTNGFDVDQLRELQSIHEEFADLLANAWGDKLRAKVNVRVTKVCEPTFGEFAFGLENPTCFLTLDLPPFAGRHCLEIQPTVLFPMIDRLLGGGKHAGPIVRRPLTEIETRLLKRISSILFDQLRTAWRKHAAIDPQIVTIESNPKTSRCAPRGAHVHVVEFEVSLPFARGSLRIGYPVAALVEVREHLSGLQVEPLGARQRGGEGSSEVRVVIAEKEVDANSEILQFQVGDIVSTGVPESEFAKIEIGGQIRHLGKLGQHEGRKAILIVRESDSHETRDS